MKRPSIAQTILGELRVTMIVRDFDHLGITTDKLFERIKILAKNAPDSKLKSHDWIKRVDNAYDQLPQNLKMKEIDITTLPNFQGILIGEVKTFAKPLVMSSSSWHDLTSQLQKQQTIAEKIESLGIKVRKTVYLINGTSTKAKPELEQRFGVEIYCEIIESGAFIFKNQKEDNAWKASTTLLFARMSVLGQIHPPSQSFELCA